MGRQMALHDYRTWTSDSRRWRAYAPRPDDIVIASQGNRRVRAVGVVTGPYRFDPEARHPHRREVEWRWQADDDNGIEVEVSDGLTGFIRRSDLARDRDDQRTDRFAVGEKVDAKITAIDSKTRKISLSIKARETEEEQEAMAEYGSMDSGASLGDILGEALKKGRS